jgi:diguanylate cyclase (GGDEF)-like protein
LISLKKYLDGEDRPRPARAEGGEDRDTVVQCYRGVLLAVGKNAAQGCPAVGADLEQGLQALEHRLAVHASPVSLERTHQQVQVQLQQWAGRTADHLKGKTDQVKELLILMANTAESVADQSQEHSSEFGNLTARLEKIATLDDLTELRTSLVERIGDLRVQVDQMKRDSRELVDQLRSEVTKCESRLKVIESLVLKDELTGMASRRSVEERMQRKLTLEQTFCLVMLDLNGFKQVNDVHGHLAGDDLLRQFAMELQVNTRAGDLVGRWGGDEFVVLVGGTMDSTRGYVQRIRDWVFGPYTVQSSRTKGAHVLHIDAAIGVAEWRGGQSVQELIAEADAAMYQDKESPRTSTEGVRVGSA